MHINALFLCNQAEIKDDRLHVTDGAWDELLATAWPAAQEIQVVALLAPVAADVDKDLDVVVRVLGPDGVECGRMEAVMRLGGVRRQAPAVLPVWAEFEVPGEYRVSVTVANGKAQTSFLLDGPPADVRVPQPTS